MADAIGLASLAQAGLAALCFVSIWMGQMTQARLDRVAGELITDVMSLRAEISEMREETQKEIQRLTVYIVSLSHQSQMASGRALH